MKDRINPHDWLKAERSGDEWEDSCFVYRVKHGNFFQKSLLYDPERNLRELAAQGDLAAIIALLENCGEDLFFC